MEEIEHNIDKEKSLPDYQLASIEIFKENMQNKKIVL